ncbi:ATP-dependent DNA ligase [Sphingobacterium sp. DK4209]|uniref:DNA ligase (ATP) n=1 Tax=Sphingobacterium zhuxiongii TaxID=2662364 RepID=A0A5Q0QBV6_9SPHI|nr:MULTISPECIES: ATP-dependent DNA ligase [unclassified Sphingobacterium]MVZ64637.1 ATP-dependent DNA ligase [Sphingobacterium sp. DK4209]QGA26976.1 ATP-dependent DNA ligase [Sphingobacterium sp. dk4302]
MKAFAQLISSLDSSNKTTLKMEAILQFLDIADNSDKLWFLSLFTGKRPKRQVSTTLMREWVKQLVDIPDWLFLESYSAVGDLAETISLLLPNPEGYIDFSLSEWMDQIINLSGKTEEEKKTLVINAWNNLPHQERFIFNKLLGGSFRIGVSAKSLINAIAQHSQLEPAAVAHSIMGEWRIEEIEFDKLINGEYVDTHLSKPYPFCLAYPIENLDKQIERPIEWQAEFKWDGIRGQIIKRSNEVFIWSRGEELVSEQFPELVEEIKNWHGDFVLDGEILAFRDHEVLNFTFLQKRLNRKKISDKLKKEIPVTMILYDLLEIEGEDCRSKPLHIRRSELEALFHRHPDTNLQLSASIDFTSLEELAVRRASSRLNNSEGLMLKHKDSIYHAGRKRGDWWKWKVDPLTIDAVLIYAQKGSGRRSGYYTDYTFAVRDGDNLVSIAKAYSGLTDKEIQEVTRFVNKNAIEKFGPVRTVKPELVFEIAFEGIGWSSRHKSGIALRFPRILRWRQDKTVADIDDLEEVKKLIQ